MLFRHILGLHHLWGRILGLLLGIGMWCPVVWAQETNAQTNVQTNLHYAEESEVRIEWAEFFVSLWPAQHRIDVMATLHLQGKKIPASLRLYVPQLIQLKKMVIRHTNIWKPLQFQRQLESATVHIDPKNQERLQIRLEYSIEFDSSKNYLFRGIFCQIKPGDSYFLYGWYPSLRPFADPLSGQLLRGHRWNYELVLEVPASEQAVAAGPLLKTWNVNKQRKRYLFGKAPMKEAAIFFSSGEYKVYRKSFAKQANILLYLHKFDSRTHLNPLARMIIKAQQYYEGLWGDARGVGVQAKTDTVVWRLVSFGGSGARGYPFTLLLDRREDFFGGSLAADIDRLFTKRHVLLHEMAHTWWGNAVTGVGEGSIWINEGLANYASIRALGALFGKEAENNAIQRHIQYFLDSSGSGRLLEPGGLAQMAQRTAYTKGALVFFELEHLLSREVVDRGLRLFFQSNYGGYVEIKHLRQALEKAAGRSLSQFFRDWVHGRGLPHMELSQSHKKQVSRHKYTLEISIENNGNIAGAAHVRVWDQRKKYDLWIEVEAGKTRKYEWIHQHRIKRVQFNPDGIMLHGFRWPSMLQRANTLRRDKKWEQAHRLFQRLEQAFPDHGQALYSWGLLQEAQKDHKAAMKLYRRASRCKPSPRTPEWVPLWAQFRWAALLYAKNKKTKAKRTNAIRTMRILLGSRINPYGLHEKIHTWMKQRKISPRPKKKTK